MSYKLSKFYRVFIATFSFKKLLLFNSFVILHNPFNMAKISSEITFKLWFY